MTIKSFKGFVLPTIHNHVIQFYPITIKRLERNLKAYAGLTGVSCADMSPDELAQLNEYSKQFAMQIDLDLDDYKDLNFNR